MKTKLVVLIFVPLLLAAFAITQQNPNPVVEAIQQHERFKESQIPLWMSDYGNLARFHEANAKLGPPAAQEQRVVFMGDSITQNWDLTKSFPGKSYVNRGISGQTTRQMLLRFRPDVLDLKPKAVVIFAGTNDIAGNTGPMTLDEIAGNIESMVELAKYNGVGVVLCSVTPVNNYTEASNRFFPLRPPEQIVALNGRIKEYCAGGGCVYVDFFSAMVDPKGLLKADLAEDGLHPNARGYAIMNPMVQQGIEQAIVKH